MTLRRALSPIRSMHWTLVGWILLPLIVTSATLVSIGLHWAGPAQEDRLKDDLELIARAVRLPISQNLIAGNLEDVQETLDSVFEIGRVYGATVFDTRGNQIASAGIAEDNLRGSRVATDVITLGETQESYREINGEGVFSQFLPLHGAGGQINGLIQITRQEADFSQASLSLNIMTWAAWFVATVLMTLMVIAGHYRGVGRHVRRLVDAMGSVGHGQRSLRVATEGPHEVQQIATALNLMLTDLEQADRDLHQQQAEQVRLNQQLQEQQKLAAIGQVARGIAHELGAPLSVISGRGRRIAQKGPLNQAQEAQLDKINRQVDRLNRIVRQLLDYCRPEAQPHRLSSPLQLAQQAMDDVSPEQSAEAPTPQLQVEGLLPDIRVDPNRVVLALVNLLRNAQQVARKSITLTICAEADQLRFTITDDGPGLQADPDELQQAFYTSKPAGEGTGLGLAIVANIAQEHQGELRLSNRADSSGCIACLCLPTPS
ncbi:MAG: HAMP domain-containing histidine kinase [Saccharospirillum sp.]|nr:HAMP domain-containing histidine kinase [Saccharospirillum sp.]